MTKDETDSSAQSDVEPDAESDAEPGSESGPSRAPRSGGDFTGPSDDFAASGAHVSDAPPPEDFVRSPTPPAARRRAFTILFFCLISTGMGNSMTFAILPPLAREISMPDIWVSLVYTISSSFFLVMSQVWGSVSDAIGRKPVVVLGLLGFSFSMAFVSAAVQLGLAGVLSVVWVFVTLGAGRAAFGALGSATAPAASAYVADRTSPSERTEALATMSAGFGLGAAIGPAFAAWLTPSLGLAAPLMISGALAIFAAVAVWRLLPERTRPQTAAERAERKPPWRYAFDRRLGAMVIFGSATWIGQAVGLQTINFYVMDRIGQEGAAAAGYAGAVLTSGALASLVVQLAVIPRMRLGPRMAMIIGGASMGLGALMLATSTEFGPILFGFTLSGLGMGFARPGMTAGMSLAVEPHEQGAAAGLAAGLAGVGFVAAPALGMGLYSAVGPVAPYWLLTAILALATVHAVLSPAIRRAGRRAG
ncbi:MAG: MFS transporter [Maricaulaceae bacterium]|jgi:MFS family permease